MRIPSACCTLLLLLPLGLAAQSAPRRAAPAPASAASPADQLKALMNLDEPGEQMRGLEAFAAAHPSDPALEDIYNAILQDATALSDDHAVLLYNEKLQALDPGDLGQRIKVLNLLLLETDAADQQAAADESDTFAKLVEAKAAEAPPEDMGPVRWRLNCARLRSVAALFQGTAAQALGQFPQAEADLVRSLQQGQTEEAAEHLAEVYVAEGKMPQAVDSFALALALPGDTIAGRAKLRAQAGDLYRQLHLGSEQGFGDLILQHFDDVAARDAAEQQQLDPNAVAANTKAARPADFVLSSLDGKPHTLNEDAGKVVVVDFWATWCGPCLVQHPIMEALKREFAFNPSVAFVSINEDEERSKVAPFLDDHGWGNDTWLDAGLGGFLGVNSLPTTLIFDPAGTVVYRQEGFVPDTFETQLRQAVKGALARALPTAAPGER